MKPVDFVRETIDLVKQIETRFLELGTRLYRIREQKLWADTYETYYDFLEAARINQSIASMLYGIHKSYIVDGGCTQEELSGIAYTNLYKAIPLIETKGIKKAVAIAASVARGDIEDEVREVKHGNHRHEIGTERWGTCGKCGKFVRILSDESH